MRIHHASLFAASFIAALLATPVAGAGPRAASASVRETGVGPAIAEQGNQALLQIRRELRVILHDQQPRTAAPDAQLSGSSRRQAPTMHVAASAGSGA